MMVKNKEEIEQLLKKMMEVSGRIAKISPIYKKDMKDIDILKVNWKICGVLGHQIFEKDNYTYKVGEKIENPDISLVINNRDLAVRFLNGKSMGFNYSPRRDYKGRFRIMYLEGFRDVETVKGVKRKQRITKHFLTARVYNEKFVHPFNLLKLPPFQIALLAERAKKKPKEDEEFGAYIPINPSVNRTMFRRIEGVTVEVDESLCNGCGKCVEVCVFSGRELVDGKAKLDLERCLGCGRCADVCPTGATTITIDNINSYRPLK